MKIGLSVVSNVITTFACVVIIAALAPQIKNRWYGTQPAPPVPRPPVEHVDGVRVSLPASNTRGNSNADVALIEFSDFECPFCGRYARDVFPEIDRDFISSGRVIYAMRQFPLPMHPLANNAGKAALCAGEQGQFWQMHDKLFDNQAAIDKPDLLSLSAAIGLNGVMFRSCLESDVPMLAQDVAAGKSTGINSTPTFLLGRVQADKTILVTTKIHGAQPASVFRAAIKELIDKVTS